MLRMSKAFDCCGGLVTYQEIGNPVAHSYPGVGRHIYCSVKTASETLNDLTHRGAAGRAVTSGDHTGTVDKFQTKGNENYWHDINSEQQKLLRRRREDSSSG